MLEQGLIVETRERPAPEDDDERRRYYRITPLGHAVARAEARRLAQLVRMARARRVRAGRGLMRAYRAPASSLSGVVPQRVRRGDARGVRAPAPRATSVFGGVALWLADDRRSRSRTPPPCTGTSCGRICATRAGRWHRSAGFALTAILVVALGIGATTAAFSVTDFVLIPAAAVSGRRSAGEALAAHAGLRAHGAVAGELSRLEARQHGRSRAWALIIRVAANLIGDGEPMRLEGARSPPICSRRSGVQPLHRPRCSPTADDRARRAPARDASYRLWQTQFGGDPGVVGQQRGARRRPTPSSA